MDNPSLRETAQEMGLAERARRLKEFAPVQHLSLLDFVRQAEVVKLIGHGRGWEVMYAGRSLGFADGSQSQALLQVHRREVNNALYAHDAGAFEWIWVELPTATAAELYPDMREIFPIASKKLSGYCYFEVVPPVVAGQSRYVRMDAQEMKDQYVSGCAEGGGRMFEVLLVNKDEDRATLSRAAVPFNSLRRMVDAAQVRELISLWAWVGRPQAVRLTQRERERQSG